MRDWPHARAQSRRSAHEMGNEEREARDAAEVAEPPRAVRTPATGGGRGLAFTPTSFSRGVLHADIAWHLALDSKDGSRIAVSEDADDDGVEPAVGTLASLSRQRGRAESDSRARPEPRSRC